MHKVSLSSIEHLAKCRCGAITVTIRGEEYSMSPKTFREVFDVTRVPPVHHKYYACNYCVNHYGIDLCACGSGVAFEKCHGGSEVCGLPMQSFRECVIE